MTLGAFMRGFIRLWIEKPTQLHYGITVCGLSIVSVNVVDFGPIKLSFAIHTGFFVINSFAAFFALILRQSVGIAVAPVVALSSGTISSVATLLLTELLLRWVLWPKCSHIGIHGDCLRSLLILHRMHVDCCRLTFVLFNSVLRKESLVSLIHRESGLIFVRQQFANIFWSCSLENLCKQKLVVSFNRIIPILRKCILRVMTISKLSGSGWFDPEGGEVLMEDVAQFFQT